MSSVVSEILRSALFICVFTKWVQSQVNRAPGFGPSPINPVTLSPFLSQLTANWKQQQPIKWQPPNFKLGEVASLDALKAELGPKDARVNGIGRAGIPPLPLLGPGPAPGTKPETEAERAERIHKAFEKMLTFVNIASQVEDYVSTKVKTAVKKVSGLVSSEDDRGMVVKCSHH